MLEVDSMAERTKAKYHQASLSEAFEQKPDNIDKLVAQAFDSDPKVREKVASDLGKIEDPRAIFALIELSADKEEKVKEAAQRSLGKFKEEEDAIVSLEKLLAARKKRIEEPETAPKVNGKKMLPTIEKLFEHYEPKKRERVKRKLFPSLLKQFGFKPQELGDPLKELENIYHKPARQETPVPAPKPESQDADNFPFGENPAPTRKNDLIEVEEHDREIAPYAEFEGADELAAESKYFKLAYELATTPGMGKAALKKEEKRIVSNFKKEVNTAFKLAAAKAKEEGFAKLTNLKPGMRGLSFSELPIASITEIDYGARKKPYMKISLWDGKREVPVLVPKERAKGILVSDRIELKKVSVDFLVESKEIVLVASRASKILVVK